MRKEPISNLKVQITHGDGYQYVVVVREVIDAMIIDRTQFSNHPRSGFKSVGTSYTILEYTHDELTQLPMNKKWFISSSIYTNADARGK